jgi:hypothetical protein
MELGSSITIKTKTGSVYNIADTMLCSVTREEGHYLVPHEDFYVGTIRLRPVSADDPRLVAELFDQDKRIYLTTSVVVSATVEVW